MMFHEEKLIFQKLLHVQIYIATNCAKEKVNPTSTGLTQQSHGPLSDSCCALVHIHNRSQIT